jgi:hypothetical protein
MPSVFGSNNFLLVKKVSEEGACEGLSPCSNKGIQQKCKYKIMMGVVPTFTTKSWFKTTILTIKRSPELLTVPKKVKKG